MKKMKWIPYLFAVLALLIGVFYDYQITAFLHHPTSYVGLFFERFALLPIQGMVIITMVLQYRLRRNPIYLLFAQIASFYLTFDFLHYWHTMNAWMLLLTSVLSIAITILTVYGIYRCSEAVLRKRQNFFLFFTLVLLSSMLVTYLIKNGWGRIRFRDLQDAAQFRVWYQPSFLSGNQSFPSGHTTAFTSILCFLHWKDQPSQRIGWLRIMMIIALTIAMPITRLMMGAHFLSDTAMGFLITYSAYLFFYQQFHKGGRI